MSQSRSPEAIIQAIQTIFKAYDEKYPEDKGFADADIAQLVRRTKARRRSDFLDEAVDALNLTDAEIEAYEKDLDAKNSKKAEELFDQMIELKDIAKAEYILNNMKNVWPQEQREEMVKKIGDGYGISPLSGLVDTKHNIKKQLKAMSK